MAQDIVMVVGLGNPGADYENTRHNAGALFVEALARSAGQTLRPEKKYHGSTPAFNGRAWTCTS